MSHLDIPLLGVFIGKSGQPAENQNHLTEVLDERVRPSYSERTLQPGRTPGPRFAGGAPELPVKAEGGWAADPPPLTPPRVARLSRRPRSRSRGLFILSRSPALLAQARSARVAGAPPSSRSKVPHPPCRLRHERGASSAAKPGEAGGADRLELPVVEQPDAPADHAEDAAREHDPGLGVGVALRGDRTLRLAAPDQVGDEVVHLAHVAAQVP